MKRGIVLATWISVVILMTATCATAGQVMDRIQKNGKLAVGMTGTQPPFSALAQSGQIIGLDADIAGLMAMAMGVKLDIVTMPFSELLPALLQGKIDVILSSMTMTLARNTKVAFVGPYYISGKGILTRSSTTAAIQQAGGLNDPKFRLAALKGSTSQDFVEKAAPKAILTATTTYDDALHLLLQDKVDAIIADLPYCAFASFRYKDKGLVAGENRLSFEPIGIALPEDPLLINWTRNFLGTMDGSGDLKRLHNRWFKDGSWIQALP